VTPAAIGAATQAALDAEENARIAADNQRVLLSDPRLTDQRTPVDDSVTTPKILNGAVTEPKLANNAVSARTIVDGAVSVGKLAASAVTTIKIADGAVTPAKLGITPYAFLSGGQQSVAGSQIDRVLSSTVTTLAGGMTATGSSSVITVPIAGIYMASVFADWQITADAFDNDRLPTYRCIWCKPQGTSAVAGLVHIHSPVELHGSYLRQQASGQAVLAAGAQVQVTAKHDAHNPATVQDIAKTLYSFTFQLTYLGRTAF
jgi:hypothetical protein